MADDAGQDVSVPTPGGRRRGTWRAVAAWSLWDWGSAAFNAVIVTFVFSVYLVNVPGKNIPGPWVAETWYSIGLAIAGFVIAVTAPLTGQRADDGHYRRRSLITWTLLTVALMAALFFVADQPHHFALGVVLLAIGSITFQYAEVSYSAMIRDVSTPQTLGRVSGIGWAAGYVGGIFLLLAAFVGFIAGDGDTRGALNLSTDNGINIRVVALLAALWFLLFAIPSFFIRRTTTTSSPNTRVSIAQRYRTLWADIRTLFRTDPNTIKFLAASAVFRDGLSGVFAYGALLAVSVYAIGEDQVLLFGVAANIVAALGAAMAGWLDDFLGPKIVIIVSLASMVAVMAVLFLGSGSTVFWVFGLALTFFVGPAQAASRSFLTRLTPVGQEGRMFGLYATTGRAVSFLAPALFALTSAIGGNQRSGIIGIALLLAVGLGLIATVRKPAQHGPTPDEPTPAAPSR